MNRKYTPKISDGISFVMPAFNCEKTITESIRSIINDNFKPRDEIIIVNDGSTDRTLKIVKNIQKKYPFIIIINNSINKGCPASRNIGIKKAKNQLIFNLDSDDVLVPGSVTKLKEYLISNRADVAAFGESHFFVRNIKNVTHKWICKNGLFTLADFLAGSVKPGGNFIYTKSSWKRIGGYWEYGRGLHEFWGFELKQIASGSKFVIMENSHYYHRYGHDSLYSLELKDENQSSLMATKMIEPFFHMLHPEDVAYIKSAYGRRHWLENLTNHQIRLKNGAVGETGRIEYTRPTIVKKYLETFKQSLIVGKNTLIFQKFYENLFRISLVGMNIGTGSNISSDGEINVIRYVRKKCLSNINTVIFDVGANVGNYSKYIINEFVDNNFQLYSFEPSRGAFLELKKRLGNHSQIKLYNIGFGEKRGAKTLFYDKKKSGLSSLYDRRLLHFGIKMDLRESIKIDTIDNFCKNNGIQNIDFLKLDTEGYELNILRGAKNMIKNNSIRFIQFEFGGCNIDSRTYFQDFFYLLKDKYFIYRILKKNLYRIDSYKEIYELFLTTNFLAMLK